MKQIVEWKERVTEKQRLEYDSTANIIAQMIGNSLIGLLFIFSAIITIENFYPTLEMARITRELLIILTFLIYGWNTIFLMKKKYGLQLAGDTVIAIAIAWFGYSFYTKKAIDIEDGMLAIGYEYLTKWNVYYGTNLMIPRGKAEYATLAFSFLTVLIVAVIVLLSALWGKRRIMLILPLTALVACLLVGQATTWFAMILCFLAAIMCFTKKWRYQNSVGFALKRLWIPILVIFFVSIFFGKPAELLVSKEESVLQFQQNMTDWVLNFNLADLFSSHGAVDNQTPVYQEKEVMKLTVNKMPFYNVYLRGFYASDYTKGMWSENEEHFEKACKQQGVTQEDAAFLMNQMNYRRQNDELFLCDSDAYKTRFTIEYTNMEESYAYLPYIVNLDEIQTLPETELILNGDYEIRKEHKAKEVQVDSMCLNRVINSNSGADITDYYGAEGQWQSEDESEFSRWYNEYVVENYLTVPETQITSKKLADSIKEYNDGLVNQLNAKNSQQVNFARCALAQRTSLLLSEQAKYSKNLDSISKDQDPIEYFLSQGHKGYCVHFASAGVFILRSLGIPARYCTGYIAKTGDFLQNGSDYSISVKDSYAHAWAEIYLEGFGWVPVEMTAGYEGPNVDVKALLNNVNLQKELLEPKENEDPETQNTEEKQNTEETQNAQETQNTEGTKNTEETQDTQNAEVSNTKSTEVGSTTGGVEKPTSIKDTSKYKSPQEQNSKKAQAIAAFFNQLCQMADTLVRVVLTVMVIGIVIFEIKKGRNQYIRNLLDKKKYRRAVSVINRRLYRSLYHMILPQKHVVSNEKILKDLNTHYMEISSEEWEQYMEISNKCAFSWEKLKEDEIRLIDKIFRECIK